jgi:DNA-directed RNA polymerase specialized sigma24 family protein
MPPTDSIADSSGLSFPSATDATSSAKPSEIEREVMNLFDLFRNPLLRYALSFGIPVHDAEEVVQEVFLSLFRHLQLRRSRKNLRGWIFRVAHNLTLKQRHANQKLRDRTAFHGSSADEQFDLSPNPEEQLSSAQRRLTLSRRPTRVVCGCARRASATGKSRRCSACLWGRYRYR